MPLYEGIVSGFLGVVDLHSSLYVPQLALHIFFPLCTGMSLFTFLSLLWLVYSVHASTL